MPNAQVSPRPLPRRAPAAALLIALLAASPVALGCSGSGIGPTAPSTPPVSAVEATSLQLLNQARRDNGEMPVVSDPILASVARAHSEAMRDRGFFDHRDPATGKTFVERLHDAGVVFGSAGENLARVSNASDPAAFAHSQFMASPEHRADILNAGFTRGGVGVARDGNTYWITQLLTGP